MVRFSVVTIFLMIAIFGCGKNKSTPDAVPAPVKKVAYDTTKVIDVSDEAFAEWYEKFIADPNSAKGVRLRVRGQIVSDAGGVSNMKMLSRQLARGCSHSVSRIGFLSKGAGFGELPDSTWVLVTARLQPDSVLLYRDSPRILMPVLEVEKFLFSIAPVNPVIGGGEGSSCGSAH